LPRLARRLEARGPRRVDAPDKTRPVSCNSGRSRLLAPDPVLARAASALKASLALDKLYQSTDRLAEADAVLAAALEDFSPTPEMPEIAPRHRRWSSVWRSAASDCEGYFVLAMESNGGFGANSGPSWGDRCRRAFRPLPPIKSGLGRARPSINLVNDNVLYGLPVTHVPRSLCQSSAGPQDFQGETFLLPGCQPGQLSASICAVVVITLLAMRNRARACTA
jgi:hypothetical protein